MCKAGFLYLITVPEVLREKLGPEAAQALVELLDRTTRQTRDEVVLLAEERFGLGTMLGVLFTFFKP